MCAIQHFKLLSYTSIVNTIESTMSSADLNGPTVLSDSALSLWTIMADVRSKANPTQSQEMTKQTCTWLHSTWTMGKVYFCSPVMDVANPKDQEV